VADNAQRVKDQGLSVLGPGGTVNYWPRWINAITNKTATLSLVAMGAYDRLLDYYYKTEEPLPESLDTCCRIVRATGKQERDAVKDVLARFFTLTGRGYEQERTEAEIAIAKPKIEAARSNGVRGGRPKGSTNKPSGLPTGFPVGTHDEPTTKAPHPHFTQPKVEIEKEPRKRVSPERPDDVCEQVWLDWLQLRKGKRAPVTATVLTEARAEACKASVPLERFLSVWCARGSQGLQADWLKPEERAGPMPTFRERDAANAAARIAEMTGGRAVAQPITRRNDVLQEIFDAAPRRLG
jgi:uncharacterized protein YdaU (DUF1376 family)